MTAPPRRFALLVAVVAFSLCWPRPAAAQQPPAAARPPLPTLTSTGSDLFRGLFAFHKIQPATGDEELDHSKLIVVVLGLPKPNDPRVVDPAGHVQRTLRAGGSVLIAVEEATTFPGYFPAGTRIEITGETITSANEARTFGGNPSCPLLEPKQPSAFDLALAQIGGSVGPEWLLFAGRDRVATNVPRSVRVTSTSRYVSSAVAGFPTGTTTANAPLPEGRAFAVGATGVKEQPFRNLVLADPSVFSNQMIASDQTDNLLFANAVVEWLQADGERSRCLFLEAGRPNTEFPDLLESVEVPPILPPIPPLPDPLDPELQRRMAAAMERGIANLDDQNGFDKMFGGEGRDNRLFNRTLKTLAVVAAVLAMFLLLRRWWTGKHEADLPALPKDTGRVAASGPPGSLARRREEILQAGNYTELVREYLREMFVSRGLFLAPGEEPPRAMPDVEATGRDAKAIRAHLRILWEVAFAAKLRPISYSRWKELEPMLEAVRHAADEGRWRFGPGGRA